MLPPALELRGVEKHYGALRPLRIRDLHVDADDCVMLLGFDRPAAEAFVNVATGATLPEKGEVVALGRPTRDIVDGDEWLKFMERFGLVTDRVALLDALTIAQNVAIAFDLAIEPIPDDVVPRVITLAATAGIREEELALRVTDAGSLLRARLLLARALAFEPDLLLLEHPTAALSNTERTSYAKTIAEIAKGSRRAIVGLTADEPFARETGGRLLLWQPASGSLRKRRAIFRL